VRSFILFLLICSNALFAQKVKNEFFALHNIIRGDSTYNTFDKQVEFVKNAGFDGIEINQIESFDGMKIALDKHEFKASFFYVKLKLGEPIDNRLENAIKMLAGTNTLISPYILGDNQRFKQISPEGDAEAIRLLQLISLWSKKAGLQVAMYPHFGFYVARTDHAMQLAQKVKRKNVGLAFNLCHWLATTNLTERANLKNHLKELKPYVKMMTICGANDVFSEKKLIFDDYILPLGTGSFDTYDLLKYMVKTIKFKNPIGVQCYNIKGNKPQLVQNTMTVWKEYKSRLENENR
jgi:sugar phosphate isomerase/epimerase